MNLGEFLLKYPMCHQHSEGYWITVQYANHCYDVRTYDEVWPAHKHAIMMLDAAAGGSSLDGTSIRLEGVGERTTFKNSGPLYTLTKAAWYAEVPCDA